MPLNDITFIRGQGVGGADPVNSHISGLLFYSNTLPSGFTSLERIKTVFSLAQAEALGIVDDFADETAAVNGTVQVTTKGATGTVSTIKIGQVVIAEYTILSTDTTPDDEAAGISAAINAGSGSHGFTSTVLTDTVTIIPYTGLGKALTGNALTYTNSGSGAATVTDFNSTSAEGSFFAVMHYHISEFFRQKPDGQLYIGIFAEASFVGDGIDEIIDYANGSIRRLGIFLQTEPYASSQLSAIQAKLVAKRDEHKPSTCIFHADCSGLTLSNLPDLTTATSYRVNVNIGEDGNWLVSDYSNTLSYNVGDKVKFLDKVFICILASTGNSPYNSNYWTVISTDLREVCGYSISTLGNEVGTKASAALSQSIAEVQAFNLAFGNILSEAGIATGELFKNLPTGQLDVLNDKNYTFLRLFVGREGVYYNDSYTAISRSNDFNSLERNEVIDESERLAYDALLPRLNSRIYLQDDGTLTKDVINDFVNLVETALNTLVISGDLSSFSVTIDPNQDILQTSKLVINYNLLPVGIARNIEVNNTYVLNL